MAGGQANNLLTIQMITREALRVLENSLTFTKQVARTYNNQFAISGAKIGDTVMVRKPPRYAGRLGQALQLEDSVEDRVPLVLTTQRGVDIVFTSAELTLKVDDFSRRFLKPAIASVANNIDYDGLGQVLTVYNTLGTLGTIPNAPLLYLQAGQRLDEEACPRDDRCIVMGPSFVPPIINALMGLFQSAERIAEQYEKGMMGIGLGFRWYMDQNVRTFASGTQAVTGLTVSGANQTGSILVTSASTGTIAAGTVFTIANVNAVNPQNRQNTGAARQFVVLPPAGAAPWPSGAPYAGVAPYLYPTGTTSLTISPPIFTFGTAVPYEPRATVTALPANAAAITLSQTPNGSSAQACAFHPEAFTCATADLLLPGGVDMAARVADDQLGMSIRAIRAYDINQDRFPTRLDILYGWATLYGEMACRIQA